MPTRHFQLRSVQPVVRHTCATRRRRSCAATQAPVSPRAHARLDSCIATCQGATACVDIAIAAGLSAAGLHVGAAARAAIALCGARPGRTASWAAAARPATRPRVAVADLLQHITLLPRGQPT